MECLSHFLYRWHSRDWNRSFESIPLLQYTTPFKLSAQLAEIAIECTFLGQKSSFWAIFLNRVGKFVVNLNWVHPKKSFWKIEFLHCIEANTVSNLQFVNKHKFLAVTSQHIEFFFYIFFIQVCHGSCVRFIGMIKHKRG